VEWPWLLEDRATSLAEVPLSTPGKKGDKDKNKDEEEIREA